MKKYKSVCYAIYENLKNIGNFKEYLINNSEISIFYHYPHGYSKTSSYVEIYQNGKLLKTHTFYRYEGESNSLKLVFYYIYFQYVLFRFVPKKSFVIVDLPMFCVLNSVTRIFKQLKFVYWIGDFYPKNDGFMKIYNKLAAYYNRKLESVWYVSPPVKEIYEKMLDFKAKNRVRILVNLGTKQKFHSFRSKPRSPLIIGFIGVIREQQGLEFIFSYLQKYDNAILEIIGAGYKLDYYKNLARKMRIAGKVKFYGYVENMDTITSKWDVGVALYENSSSNVSLYCEPVKIKNYLEFGLPVITTKTTYLVEELEKERAGIGVDETVESLEFALKRIRSNYPEYRKGVMKMLNRYEYVNHYDKILKFMRK